MTRRFFLITLLIGCCVALAGCPSADGPADPENVGRSIRYYSLNSQAGLSQAVVVKGLPLVHTRQLLPLDAQGELVGGDSAEQQIEQVLDNLQAVLETAGSGLEYIVRLNVYADSSQTVDFVRDRLCQRLNSLGQPTFTAVVSPLPHPGALVAVDAVAVPPPAYPRSWPGDAVVLKRCETVGGDTEFADAAVMPVGGVVYLSGQPDKSPRAEAAAKSLAKLFEIVDQLQLERSHVVQLKVFIDSATEADEVLREVKRQFPDRIAPPVVFVEWIASAPVEIEMIVHAPLTGDKPHDAVRYYTPPGVKPSPTFSRVAVVESHRQIYISGLSAREGGDGESQVRDVFAQLKQVLSETDSDLRHLAKATYYVSDEDVSTKLNELRPEFYDPERPPAASKAMVHGMGQSDRTLTIDMIAVPSAL